MKYKKIGFTCPDCKDFGEYMFTEFEAHKAKCLKCLIPKEQTGEPELIDNPEPNRRVNQYAVMKFYPVMKKKGIQH